MSANGAGSGRYMAALVLGVLAQVGVVDAAVQAHLSQNPVYLGDTLTLTISTDNGSSSRPDLSPLQQDFEIVGSGSSSQLSISNGRTASQMQWQIELQPRHSGELTIPALQVGGERSQALAVKVTDAPPADDPKAAAAGGHVFVETQIDPGSEHPYVQQQVGLRVRLYYDDAVGDGALSDPQIDNAVVEQHGEEQRSTAVRNNRQYHVIERHYAIFPQQSGVLEIPPVRFEGTVMERTGPGRLRSRSDSPMQRLLQGTPLANDPLFRGGVFGNDAFSSMFGAAGQSVRIFSPSLKLNVRPPAAARTAWLPATALRLHDSWRDAPPQLKAGEPVTRTLTVEAEGLTGPQIPSLDLPAPAGMRLYPDPVDQATHDDGQHLVGISRQTLTYIPDAGGSLTLPPVRIDWWDLTRDTAAEASLPAWNLSVAGGKGATANPPVVAPSSAVVSANPPAKTPVTEAADVQVGAGWRRLLSDARILAGGAVALVFALGLLGWRFFARRQRRPQAGLQSSELPGTTHPAVAATPPVPATDESTLLRQLETACAERNAALAGRTLLSMGKVRWPQHPPHNLADLADRLRTGDAAVRALERNLYGLGDNGWPADQLWEAMRTGLPTVETDHRSTDHADLPPLYPHHA